MMHVLIVDDEQSIRDSFELALELVDQVETKTAADGIEALEILSHWSAGLMFLDLKMPRMNGIQTLREVKRLYPQTKVFVVTAFAREFTQELDQLEKEGIAFELAAKPINLEQIQLIVSNYME